MRQSASSACFWSGLVSAEGIMPSGSYVPHQQVEHMAAPTEVQCMKKPLANGEPSTHGALPTFGTSRRTSALGRKPDVSFGQRDGDY